MAKSLDELSKILSHAEWFYHDNLKIMRRKDVYSYEYIDSWEKFEETALPPKEAFYSNISDKDYEHAKEVWDLITPEKDHVTLGDYHDIYLAADVLLLAVVFETFRDMCLENYRLDPAHFYTALGLAWQAALKYTDIKLELLSDYDMLLMYEKGIRGGITQAVHRLAKTNNKYMWEQYNPTEDSIYLQYLDVNNLYGEAISQHLTTHGFKWMSNIE